MNRRIVLNAGMVWFARIVSVVVSFFLFPFMLTHLGAEPVGLLSLAASFSVAGGIMTLLDFGVQGALIVYVARYIARQDWPALNKLFSTAFVLYGALGAVASLLLFFLSDGVILYVFKLSSALVPAAHIIFRLAALQVGLEFIGMVPLAALEGNQDYRITQGLAVGLSLLTAVATVGIIWLGYGIVTIAFLQCGGVLVRVGATEYLMFRRFPGLNIRRANFSWRLCRELLQFSKPIFGERLGGLVFRQTDRLIVGSWLSVALVAHYNVIQNLYRSIMLFQSFSPVITPATSAVQGDLRQLRDLFVRNTKYATWLTSGVAATAAVLLPWLIRHWVGNDFVYLTPLARAYVLITIGASAFGVGQAMMTPLGRAREVMIYGLIGGGKSLTGSLLTVGRWQLAGIVWTTVLGMAVNWALHLRLFVRELRLTWQEVLVSLAARAYTPIAAVSLGLWTVVEQRAPTSLLEVFAYGAAAMAVNGLLFYFVGLERVEQISIGRVLKSRLSIWRALVTTRRVA